VLIKQAEIMKSFVLDVREEECPGPLVKTARTFAKLSKGDELIILTNIEECVHLIRETVETLNVDSIHIKKIKNYWEIVVKI